MSRIRVCIVLEGSYPFITGGVSAWVQDIISGLPEIDFALFTLSPEKDMELRYTLPPNVVEHKDVVIWETYKSVRKPSNLERVMALVRQIHQVLYSNTVPLSLDALIRELPEGYFFTRDAVLHDTGWNLITESNELRNPLYPFTDYFWAWNSAHTMLFNAIGAEPPDADIYHSVSTGFAGVAALAAQIRRKKPFLLTEHGLYHKEREMEISKAKFVKGYQRDMWIHFYTQLSKICYHYADKVTALFEENRQKQLELGVADEKAVVIPNGIDVERFSVNRIRKEGFHVGLVGRVVPIKDIKTFIATAKIIEDAIPDARFYCIGPTDEDPEYYHECQLLVQSLKLEDSFEFTGRQNVLEYYNFLDVLMLTSVREAQPLVILEAYSAGLPVVSTRVGNVAEMLGYDDRFIAPLKNAEKLAEGVIYIHDHPGETAELVKRNMRTVHTFYNKNDLRSKYARLYEEMTGAG